MSEASRATEGGAPVSDATHFPYAVLDQSLWARFQHAQNVQEFLDAWLALVSRQIDGLASALLMASDDGGAFQAVARWPTGTDTPGDLAEACGQSIAEHRSVVFGEGTDRRVLAHPLMLAGQLFGAIAVTAPAKAAPTAALFRRLQWAEGWIEVLIRREQEVKDSELRERVTVTFDMLATLLEHQRIDEATAALVTDLARRLDCETVSLGFARGRHVRVYKVSNAASFGRRSNLIREVGLAMEEAVDQEAVVLWPQPEQWEFRVNRAHKDLAITHGVEAVLTIPLTVNDKIIGALTFERREGKPFTAADVEVCDAVAAIAGPIVEDRRRASRWLPMTIASSAKRQLLRLLGPSHFGAKLATLAVAATAAALWYVTLEYQISASARLEGTVQRSIVAPFNGYLASQNARAGDLVEKDQILAVLDEKDLSLEQLRLTTTKQQRSRELDRTIAERKMAEANIIRAQLDQADAQLALVEEQLARTRIRAPFTGYVVEGDLSQQVGASIERGQTLFRLAPLNGFRVVLEIDERDIADVAVGQQGKLRLAAFPEMPLDYVVTEIMPMAQQGQGRNFFRVEANLRGDRTKLRPGMEGISRTAVNERRLGWLIFHDFLDWLRLAAWRWAP